MARGANFDSTTVASVMSRQVVCCFSDDNLAEAEKLMLERCVRRVLVLHRGTNQLVGIVSVDDIALLASRGRAGRVLEHLGATPNEVFRSASVVTSSMDTGTHA
jgi:CBS domain-containing protein